MNETYLMRSLMFVPAHNQKLLDSSLKRDADVLLLDIEDSVPITEKQTARDNIKEFVKRNDLNGKLIFPRVNDRESGELLKDAYQLTIDGVHGFMYPKATKGEDIYDIEAIIYCLRESHKGIIIGKGGQMLKRISTYARQDSEKMLNTKVNLKVWVKVKEDWLDSDNIVKKFKFNS